MAGQPEGVKKAPAYEMSERDKADLLEYQYTKKRKAMMKKNRWAAVAIIVFLFVILLFVAIALIPSQISSDGNIEMAEGAVLKRSVDLGGTAGTMRVDVDMGISRGQASFYFFTEDDYNRAYSSLDQTGMIEASIAHAIRDSGLEFTEKLEGGTYYIVITELSDDAVAWFDITYYPFRIYLIPGVLIGIAGVAGGAIAFNTTHKKAKAMAMELKRLRVELQVQSYEGLYGSGPGGPGGGAGGTMGGYGYGGPGRGGPGGGGPGHGGPGYGGPGHGGPGHSGPGYGGGHHGGPGGGHRGGPGGGYGGGYGGGPPRGPEGGAGRGRQGPPGGGGGGYRPFE